MVFFLLFHFWILIKGPCELIEMDKGIKTFKRIKNIKKPKGFKGIKTLKKLCLETIVDFIIECRLNSIPNGFLLPKELKDDIREEIKNWEDDKEIVCDNCGASFFDDRFGCKCPSCNQFYF